MKNRAKCKLCESIIESFHRYDYVSCKCGEISVDGGNDDLRCSAIHWENFLRIDDEGNIIIPKIVEKEQIKEQNIEEVPKLTKEDMLKMLSDMIKSIEDLPSAAMTQSVTYYDLQSFMLVVHTILKI